jgi:hypothetical protein
LEPPLAASKKRDAAALLNQEGRNPSLDFKPDPYSSSGSELTGSTYFFVPSFLVRKKIRSDFVMMSKPP